MNRKKIVISIALFWGVLILGFIGYKEFTLRMGQEVLLKPRPVDPRDLFRGDYVILDYEINTLRTDILNLKDLSFKKNDVIYISLNVDEKKIGSFASISKEKPVEGIFIKGTVRNVRENRLNIEYGIESYFVPEGKGRLIEGNLDKIYTKIAVDSYGNALIKALILYGEEIDLK